MSKSDHGNSLITSTNWRLCMHVVLSEAFAASVVRTLFCSILSSTPAISYVLENFRRVARKRMAILRMPLLYHFCLQNECYCHNGLRFVFRTIVIIWMDVCVQAPQAAGPNIILPCGPVYDSKRTYVKKNT
jgi:hypothetical protein